MLTLIIILSLGRLLNVYSRVLIYLFICNQLENSMQLNIGLNGH